MIRDGFVRARAGEERLAARFGLLAVGRSGKISVMRNRLIGIGVVQLVLVLGLWLAVRSGRVPLGVPGEWVWLRVYLPSAAFPLLIGAVAVIVYSAFACFGYQALARRGTTGAHRGIEAVWLGALFLVAIGLQGLVQEAAPAGHGLSKWALALINSGSSGYYTIAKNKIAEPSEFLRDYPRWIRTQGSLHIGTHPPGLFLEAYAALRLMETHPNLSKAVLASLPESVSLAFKVIAEKVRIPVPDRASMALTGFLTLLCCAGTVVPLYLLARLRLEPPAAWAVACVWPLVPATLLFQPAADTAFPILTTLVMLLNAWSERRWGWSIAAGALLAIGMQFSLVFLPVGLIVALVIGLEAASAWPHRGLRFLATGFGFLAVTFAFWALTHANPFAIWWANQVNHSRFYAEYPRSYLPWLIETPIEVAIAIGLPAAIWLMIGIRSAPREALATIGVLLTLLLTGRSLSEVARLWIPFFPLVGLSLGRGFERLQAGRLSLAWTLALMGTQTIILQTLIQVLYPA